MRSMFVLFVVLLAGCSAAPTMSDAARARAGLPPPNSSAPGPAPQHPCKRQNIWPEDCIDVDAWAGGSVMDVFE